MNPKIAEHQHSRSAYVYLRQSTLGQVHYRVVFPGSRTSLLPLDLQGAGEFTLVTGPARDALQTRALNTLPCQF
jgi:hypothetical protein